MMNDANKTKAQLLVELTELRQQVIELEALENRKSQTEVIMRKSEEWTDIDITDRKQIEETLQQSEHRFHNIIKNIPGMVYQFRVRSDGSNHFSYTSPRATELFGFPADRNDPDWTLGTRVHPDDQDNFFVSVAQAIENRTDWVFEGRMTTLNDEIKWFQGISSPSQQGEELVFNGVLLDISERKQAEEALRASEEKYRDLVENMQDVIYITDSAGNITYASPAVEAFLGYPFSEVIDQPFARFIHPEDLPRIQDSFRNMAEGRQYHGPNEYRAVTQSEEIRWMRISSRPILQDNQFVGVQGILADITENKRAEKALRESEQKARSIIESIPLGMHMYELDANNRLLFTDANPAADEILGIDHRQFVGLTIKEAFPPLSETEIPDRYRLAAQQGVLLQTEQIVYEDDKIQGAYEIRAFQTTPGKMAAVFQDVTDRKRTEETLLQSEKLYRSLFEGIDDTILVHDAEGNILDINQAACRRLGYTREELLQMKTTDIDTPDFAAGFKDRTAHQLTEGKLSGVGGIHVARDGRWIHVDVNTRLINYQGKLAILGVVRDITERKRMEEDLRNTNALLERIFDTSHVHIAYMDRDFNFVRVNLAYAKADNREPAFFIGKNHFDLYPHPENKAIFRRVVGTGEPYTVQAKPFEYPDNPNRGTTYWDWSLAPVRNDLDEVEALLFILSDVTERKQAEMELEAARKQYQSMFEKHVAIMLLIEPESGDIVLANQAACQYYGYMFDELVSMKITDINQLSAEQVHEEMQRVRMENRNYFVFRHALSSGEIRDVEVRSGPIVVNGRTLLYSIVHDITERLEAEKRRRELEMEQELANVLQHFISNASHDLRTPITTIKTIIYLLQHQSDSVKRQHNMVVLETQVEHLETLLEAMLSMSRLDKVSDFEFEVLNLNILVEDIVARHKSLTQQMHQSLNFIRDSAVPAINGDKSQLERALTSIVSNAVHYTPEHGSIMLRTYLQEQQIVIEIQDTGIGIGSEDLPHIFDRFYRVDKARRTAKGGTGLGLAIAKRIIEVHQGKIEVESKLGGGSVFRVSFPII